MKKILILVGILFVIGIGLMLMPTGEESGLAEAENIGRDWVENEAPTYVYDGSNLTLVDSQIIDDDSYELVFEFDSAVAGYGDREGEASAQVITPHTTMVRVENGQVTEAITDEVFSEVEGKMIGEEEVNEETAIEEVEVYFMTVEDGAEEVVPVQREVPEGSEPVEIALQELLRGPSDEEDAEGYTTAINEEVSIQEIEIDEDDGLVYVNFSAELNEGVAGSATVTAIREQIERTLLQFGWAEEVVIAVEGETEGVLQP